MNSRFVMPVQDFLTLMAINWREAYPVVKAGTDFFVVNKMFDTLVREKIYSFINQEN